jgi:hypothetical protein
MVSAEQAPHAVQACRALAFFEAGTSAQAHRMAALAADEAFQDASEALRPLDASEVSPDAAAAAAKKGGRKRSSPSKARKAGGGAKRVRGAPGWRRVACAVLPHE